MTPAMATPERMKSVLVKLTGLQGNSLFPDGSQQSKLELKAWVKDIRVIWELRRVLAILNPQRLKLDVKKILWQSRQDWYILMRSYGLTEDEALFLNRASLAAQGKQPGPYTHEEHGVPTETVLAIAADGALYRKRSKERQHYQQFINCLVAAVLPADKQARLFCASQHLHIIDLGQDAHLCHASKQTNH